MNRIKESQFRKVLEMNALRIVSSNRADWLTDGAIARAVGVSKCTMIRWKRTDEYREADRKSREIAEKNAQEAMNRRVEAMFRRSE